VRVRAQVGFRARRGLVVAVVWVVRGWSCCGGRCRLRWYRRTAVLALVGEGPNRNDDPLRLTRPGQETGVEFPYRAWEMRKRTAHDAQNATRRPASSVLMFIRLLAA